MYLSKDALTEEVAFLAHRLETGVALLINLFIAGRCNDEGAISRIDLSAGDGRFQVVPTRSSYLLQIKKTGYYRTNKQTNIHRNVELQRNDPFPYESKVN